jgi:hypothetical protein
MRMSPPIRSALFVILAFVATACTDSSDSPALLRPSGSAAATPPGFGGFPTTTPMGSTQFSIQPNVIDPIFVGSPFCDVTPAFDAVLTVTTNPNFELFLSRIRFNFTDDLGRGFIPTATPIPSINPPAPSSIPPLPQPLPLPSAAPITFSSTPIGPGRSDSFRLGFDCQVLATGTLAVFVQTVDVGGVIQESSATARIGR